MTYLPSQGTAPDGSATAIPVSGRIKGNITPLGANASWSTGWIDTDDYVSVITSVFSNVSGSYLLEYSEDNGASQSLQPITIQYNVPGQVRKGMFDPSARYVRFTYTNGATAQTSFNFSVNLNTSQGQTSNETLNAVGADTRTAQWTKTRIETKTSDSTNDYAPIYRTGNALNVNDSDIGSTTDTLVTDPTQAGTVIALLKGLLQESVAQASTGTFTAYSLAANVAQTIPAASNGKGRIITSVSGTILVAVGFTATANNYSYRIVTNGTVEIRPEWGTLAVSLFSTTASTVNVTVMA